MSGSTWPDRALNSGEPYHPSCNGCFSRRSTSTLTLCNMPGGCPCLLTQLYREAYLVRAPVGPRLSLDWVQRLGIGLVLAAVTSLGLISAVPNDARSTSRWGSSKRCGPA